MEEFKDIDEYYAISNYGRVKSLRSNKILKLKEDSKGKGYKYITLNYNGVKKGFQIHRLVAKAFIPNPNNLPCVNHKDENPSNNYVENLEWCSYSYNLSYGTKILREHKTKIENNSVNAPKKVVQKDKQGNVIQIFESANSAARYLGFHSQHILDCCNHKISTDKDGYKYQHRTYKGYIFEFYKEEIV